MTKITDKQIDELRRIAAKLAQLLAAIDSAGLEIPPEVAALVEKRKKAGICLACEQLIQEGDRARRGLDSACYATTMARIRRGDTTEAAEILAGKLAGERMRAGRTAKMDRIETMQINEDAKQSVSAKKSRKK